LAMMVTEMVGMRPEMWTRDRLSGADLRGANLSRADLSGAKRISNEELEQEAESLEGATMPNGQKYED
jgi:uncharacterized protein YjbI with pentapeptide repeats